VEKENVARRLLLIYIRRSEQQPVLWFLPLPQGAERGCRVFESEVLRVIFGFNKKEEIGWNKLSNDELHLSYTSPNNYR
jgi:hypothetical protein